MIGKKINQLATELAPVSTDLTIIGDPISGVSKKITLAQLGAIFSGAVSFYTNLAGFPATGDINVIYCAKDTQKLYLWSGSAYTEVFPSQALLNTYQLRSEKGVSNGYASLDSLGKVPISQLPSSLMEYKGTWNAATNTPTLANGAGDTGDVYICNVAGTVNFGAGPITFAVGDYTIYSGSIWQRSSGAVGTVTSVAVSRSGDALAITGSPITTSGTINIGFAGTGTQYIKGDGTLATFPSIISQAQNLITEVYNNTGATLTKGTIVYINGGQGNLPTVTKALATGDSTSAQTYGVVQTDITNMNNGYVVVEGRLGDLDTQAYANGTQLYLSPTTAGTWTSTKPYAPNHLVYVGIVVRAHPTQGIVEVKIQNGYELDELHNVAAKTPTNNDGLFWESATSLWKNKSISTVLGYTPQPQLSGTGFVKISGTTISYDNSTYLTTSAAASTYLPLILNGSANTVDINGQQFTIQGSAGGFTSGRIIVDPVFSAIGYQNAGVFDGLKILTNGNAEFSNSGVTRFFNQVRFDSTLTNGTYTYTLPGATGTLALVSQLTGGTVTSVGLSSATSGVTIGSSPITTSGTITLAIATASGSQQGLLSSTDWTTFNNKQNALTNPVTGTGTTNYLPKFTGTSTIGNSLVYDNGTQVAVATSNPSGFGTQRFLAVGNGAASQVARFTDGANGDLVFDFPSATISRITAQYGTGGILVFANGTGFNELMRLNASGNLSIGNTNNTYKLDVTGTGRFTGSVYSEDVNAYLLNQTGNTTDTKLWSIQNLPTSGQFRIRALNDGMTNGINAIVISRTGISSLSLDFTGAATFSSTIRVEGSYLQIANATNPSLYINNTSVQWQTYVKSNSNYAISDAVRDVLTLGYNGSASYFNGCNVGIGTTSPSQNLHVASSGISRILIENTANASTGAGLQMLVTSGGTQVGNGTIRTDNSDNMQFFNLGGERMRITSGGNVGIGTTSPSAVLEVAGTSANTDFRISRTVSSSTYFYIKAPGGSPSTATMGVNGVDVMALKSNQVINFVNVPTSSAGLSSGDIYKTVAGVLMIV